MSRVVLRDVAVLFLDDLADTDVQAVVSINVVPVGLVSSDKDDVLISVGEGNIGTETVHR